MESIDRQQIGSRHKWFPAVVLISTAALWWWRASYARYYTLTHYGVLLVVVLLLLLWFGRYGGWSPRVRRTIPLMSLLGLVAFFVVFRPVYNGDMGIYRWRLRFANIPDASLQQLISASRADDWQTTPRDYPRFLGNGYWAEVKGVELETDWKAHPPQEMWRREIGAGWSAFAIVGGYAVTQEQ